MSLHCLDFSSICAAFSPAGNLKKRMGLNFFFIFFKLLTVVWLVSWSWSTNGEDAYGDELHPPAFPHTHFRRNVGWCASTRTLPLPFSPPRAIVCVIIFPLSKVTDCSLLWHFPRLLSLQVCIHSGHCSFLTRPGREPAASRSWRSSVLGVEWCLFHFR